MRKLLLGLLLLFSPSTFADTSTSTTKIEYPVAKDSYPYKVKVRDIYGAEGFGFDYFMNSDGIVVVFWDDFGSKPKEVFKKAFSNEEKKAWSAFLAGFPLDSLKTEYVNRSVADGLQMVFDFRLDQKPPKKISLSNMPQKDLERLCAELNRLLPEKLRARQGRGAVRVH